MGTGIIEEAAEARTTEASENELIYGLVTAYVLKLPGQK